MVAQYLHLLLDLTPDAKALNTSNLFFRTFQGQISLDQANILGRGVDGKQEQVQPHPF